MSTYVDELGKVVEQSKRDSSVKVEVHTLATKEKEGEELDTAIQEYVESLRETGTVISTTVVMAGAIGISS